MAEEALSPPVDASDYGYLDGGLRRMLDRLRAEGTATKSPDADQLLRDEPNAVLLGLLFDQRVLAETAFVGPLKLKERLGHLDLAVIAEMEPQAFQEAFARPPAVHRFTAAMAERTQALARALAADWGGRAENLWSEGACADVEARIRNLPGFGPMKAAKLKHCLYYFGHRDLSE